MATDYQIESTASAAPRQFVARITSFNRQDFEHADNNFSSAPF
jgi:hypothetical protein